MKGIFSNPLLTALARSMQFFKVINRPAALVLFPMILALVLFFKWIFNNTVHGK